MVLVKKRKGSGIILFLEIDHGCIRYCVCVNNKVIITLFDLHSEFHNEII